MTLNSRLVNLAGIARRLVESGLLLAYGGSVSLRWEDQCYISARHARLDHIGAGDFVPLALPRDNEWLLPRVADTHAQHLACYRARPDVLTVLHLALPHCVALGCAGLSLDVLTPAYHQSVDSRAPLLPYPPHEEAALLTAITAAAGSHNALLLLNQGVLVMAPSSDEALLRAQAVEQAAHITLLARAAMGQCTAWQEPPRA